MLIRQDRNSNARYVYNTDRERRDTRQDSKQELPNYYTKLKKSQKGRERSPISDRVPGQVGYLALSIRRAAALQVRMYYTKCELHANKRAPATVAYGVFFQRVNSDDHCGGGQEIPWRPS